ERDEQRERQQKFHRRRQPERIAHVRAIRAQQECRERDGEAEDGRLPQMVRERRDHRLFSGLSLVVLAPSCCRSRSRCPIVFSSSGMPPRASLPASASCAIIGSARPPKKLRISSSRRCRATSRATTGSKMWALPVFFTRRTAFFASIRYTVVWI